MIRMRTKSHSRCLLFVVDALSDRVVRSNFKSGLLPNLSRIVDSDGAIHQCLSIFPSITPAATCSIATGCYPKEHHIEGASWFDRERGEIAYFGDDLQFTLERGMSKFFEDFADHLNFELLRCPTVFERLHELEIDSACINFMWFAGPHWHDRRTPWLTRILAGKLAERVRGPKFLKLGDFVETLPRGVKNVAAHTFLGRYGFKDGCTEEVLIKMANADAIPPFTLGYFPTNDDISHTKGPNKSAEQVLQPFDKFLGEFVEAAGGWDRLGQDLFILIVGDHSQTEFSDGGPVPIRIDQSLRQFRQASPGGGWEGDDEIFVCPNMRATAIYLRNPTDEILRQRIVSRALAEPYIDQVIYEDNEGGRVIETANRGKLVFNKISSDASKSQEKRLTNASRNGDESQLNSIIHDEFDNRWLIHGDLGALDCKVDLTGRLMEGRYPNPLERIDGAFVEGARPIWLTAGVDAEFRLGETSTHSGGSHGALNFEDSETVLITSKGISLDSITNPTRPRIIDVAKLCLNLFSRLRTNPADSNVYTAHQTSRKSV